MNMFERPPETSVERKEHPPEKLDELLRTIALRENEAIASTFGVERFLDDSCAIRTECFGNEGGKVYDDASIREDGQYVDAKEREWAGWWNETVRKEVYEKNGITSEEEAVKDWKGRKEHHASAQFEKVVTVILHKMLGDDFLVLRASAYDDYKNGIDNLIVNKATGDVVCAFDELNYSERDTERQAKKIARVKERAMRGGSEAKYGASVEEGKLIMERIRHVPLFFLSLPETSLRDIMKEMDYSPDSVSPVERKAFEGLMRCLKDQIGMLAGEKVHPEVEKRIQRFEETLKAIDARHDLKAAA